MTDLPPATTPIDARRAALRTTTLHLVLGVVTLDAVALLLFYGFDVSHRAAQTRTTFVAIWTFVTALTVAFLLRRVRLARRA